MIVEMAGRPPEHVKESLSKHVEVLDKMEYIKLHSIKVSDPKEIEGSQGLFTCFAEVDFETENFGKLSETMFDFMPSSIEVIEPTKINMGMHDATNLLNNISGRMHRYDELARIAQAKIQQLTGQLQATQQTLIGKDKKKTPKKKVVKKVKKKSTKKK